MLESVPGMSKMVASVVISAKKTSSPAPPSKKSGAVKVSIKSEPAQQQQQRTTHVKPETVKRPGLTGEQNAMEEAARQLEAYLRVSPGAEDAGAVQQVLADLRAGRDPNEDLEIT